MQKPASHAIDVLSNNIPCVQIILTLGVNKQIKKTHGQDDDSLHVPVGDELKLTSHRRHREENKQQEDLPATE